jgi:hypothetical protein
MAAGAPQQRGRPTQARDTTHPCHAAPPNANPPEANPRHANPRQSSPPHTNPLDANPREATRATPPDATSSRPTPTRATPPHATPTRPPSPRPTPTHTTPRHPARPQAPPPRLAPPDEAGWFLLHDFTERENFRAEGTPDKEAPAPRPASTTHASGPTPGAPPAATTCTSRCPARRRESRGTLMLAALAAHNEIKQVTVVDADVDLHDQGRGGVGGGDALRGADRPRLRRLAVPARRRLPVPVRRACQYRLDSA